MQSLTRRHILQAGTSSIAMAAVEFVNGGALALGASGCAEAIQWTGVDASSGQRIDLRAGPMPDGGSFTGSYYSPQCSRLQLVQRDAEIVGSYRRDDDPRSVGTLVGHVTGNVADFRWAEYELPDEKLPVLQGTGFFLLDLCATVTESARLFGRRAFHVRERKTTGAKALADGNTQWTTRDGGLWTAVRIVQPS